MFARFLTRLGYFFLACLTLGILGVILLVALNVPSIPRVPNELNRLIAVPPTEIYASDGSLLTRVGGRKAVPIERISEKFQMSVLAAEDDEFYLHYGIDKPATIKAVLGAVTGSKSRGGSTITQQLARNLFFTFKKTYARKFREILASFEIEKRFSKDEILNAYCNGIFFGNYSYGVEEAATSYFGKHAANLSWSEASMLAGLPNSPSRFNPYRYPERAAVRQKWIAGRLKKLGRISESEYRHILQEKLDYKPLYASADEGSYFLDATLDGLEEKYGKTALYHGGLKIYTTLSPTLQQFASQSVKEGLGELDIRMGLEIFDPKNKELREEYPQASLVAIEAATGAIQALVGGRDWQASQFNRAIQANRNMGSVLKPILYLTAIEKLRIHPASLVMDSSFTIEIAGTDSWAPQNFENMFRGQMILKYALEHSVNTVAARLMAAVEPESMLLTLRRFGVESPLLPHYSMALGGAPITNIELSSIGAGIANMGEVVEPYLIRRIEDAAGTILEEHIVRREPSFNQEDVYLLIDMMKGVMEEGTGRSVERYGFNLPSIGKTGTTDDYRDSWFLGATPRLSCAVWVGYDDYREMRDKDDIGITGGAGALPIWAMFMKKATEGEPPRDFNVIPGIMFEDVNRVDGYRSLTPASELINVALPSGISLPDSTLLKIEASWVKVDSSETATTDSLEAVE